MGQENNSKPKWNTPEYRKWYYAQNKERLKAQGAAYREAHREELRLYAQKYRQENPEKHKESAQKSSLKRRDKHRAYICDHREKLNAQQRERRANDPEKYREKEKRWRQSNPEAHAAKNKRAWDKQREKWIAGQKEWRKNNLDKERRARKRWREANPDKVRAAARRKYERHSVEMNEKNKQWRWRNPEKWEAIYKKVMRSENRRQWIARNRLRHNEMRLKKYYQYKEQYREFYRLYGTKAPRRCVIFMKWEMTGHLCYICGQYLPFDDIHVDHVIPITKNGTNDIHNLMPTHSKCNKNKSDRLDYPVKRPDLIAMVVHLEAHPRTIKREGAA